MMGVRADMTLQVARIASSRLAKSSRPLRLCYAGEVLRVGGGKLSSSRQLRQIGCELIGSLEAAADAEIVLLGARALGALGVAGLSIDLNLPTMVPAIFSAHGVTGAAEQRLASALSHRDSAAVSKEPEIGARCSPACSTWPVRQRGQSTGCPASRCRPRRSPTAPG